jgi:hypothetical protein
MIKASWVGAKAQSQGKPVFVRMVKIAEKMMHRKNQSIILLELDLFLTLRRYAKLVPASTSIITPTRVNVLKLNVGGSTDYPPSIILGRY